MVTLAEATEAYQAQRELLRSAENELEFSPDHEEMLAELRADTDKAREAMEIAWLALLWETA